MVDDSGITDNSAATRAGQGRQVAAVSAAARRDVADDESRFSVVRSASP